MTLTDPRKLTGYELVRDIKTAIRTTAAEHDQDKKRKIWKRVAELLEEVERRLALREPYRE